MRSNLLVVSTLYLLPFLELINEKIYQNLCFIPTLSSWKVKDYIKTINTTKTHELRSRLGILLNP